MNLSPLASKISWAVLYGVVTFIIVLIIGILLSGLGGQAEIGDVLKRFAPLLGILVGIAVFFGGRPV